MIGPTSWRDEAACGGANPELFRPEQPPLAAAATIRRFCWVCPVADACRAEAVKNRDRGVWGGRYFSGWPKPRARAPHELTTPLPGSAADSARKGACPSCGRDAALRGDGRLHRHLGHDKQPCPGHGYLPREQAS